MTDQYIEAAAQDRFDAAVSPIRVTVDLTRVPAVARYASARRGRSGHALRRGLVDEVDLASDESFPASDPPAWVNR